MNRKEKTDYILTRLNSAMAHKRDLMREIEKSFDFVISNILEESKAKGEEVPNCYYKAPEMYSKKYLLIDGDRIYLNEEGLYPRWVREESP